MKRFLILLAVVTLIAGTVGCRRWAQRGAYVDPWMTGGVTTSTTACDPCNPCDPCGAPMISPGPEYGPGQ